MLFDVATDPHETADLAGTEPARVKEGAHILEECTAAQLARSVQPVDPDRHREELY